MNLKIYRILMKLIYLDYAATTPISDNVKKIMVDTITNNSDFYNSGSSTYDGGEVVKNKIEESRKTISNTLNILPREIIFTSGATESNNLAIKGVAESYKHKGKHIVTSKIEHKAVLDVCKHLETLGFRVTYLDVDSHGLINAQDVERAITNDTILVSLMAVNNELGVVNDLYAIGQITKKYGVLFHVDAAQGYGKIDIDIKSMNIDLLSVSGHKIYGPKGIGFLYVRSKRPRVKLSKIIHGGTQEFDLRAGTLANHQIFALAEASDDMFKVKEHNRSHVSQLRNAFLGEMQSVECMKVNTPLNQSYHGILNITFNNIKAETLLAMLDGACMSVGSACNSRAVEPSHVLSAIGLNQNQSDSTIRISFGLMTTNEEILTVAKNMKDKVAILQAISPSMGVDNV